MSLITVLGSSGFIGSHLVERIRMLGLSCNCPGRAENLSDKNLGHVIYCIGLTADFRRKPFETVDAHVCKLREVLERCDFDSLSYLSSTRLYKNSAQGATTEDATIHINPLDPSDIFNISKAMGESLLFACDRPKVRSLRLSNVYGYDFGSENFLTSIIRDAVVKNEIVLRTTMESAKDYISIVDVAETVIKVALSQAQGIYNLASGVNVTNRDIINELRRITGCRVEVDADAETIIFPQIDVMRIRNECDFSPRADLLSDLPGLVDSFRFHLAK